MIEAIQKWTSENEADEITMSFAEILTEKNAKLDRKTGYFSEYQDDLQQSINKRAEELDLLEIETTELSKKAQEIIQAVCDSSMILKLRDASSESYLSELSQLEIRLQEYNDRASLYAAERIKQDKLTKELEKMYRILKQSQEWTENQKKEFSHAQNEIDDRINDILLPKSKEYKAQIINYQKEIELSDMSPELEHESLKLLYGKMKSLEEQFEKMTKEHGPHQDLPLNEQEADSIIYQKRKELEELESKLSAPLLNYRS